MGKSIDPNLIRHKRRLGERHINRIGEMLKIIIKRA